MDQTFHSKILPSPNRVEVCDASGKWLATFTVGCYTVTLAGPRRSFNEQTASVSHSVWVRTLPRPFRKLNPAWLSNALQANTNKVPDILAIAMQYIRGAPPIFEGDLQIAGDARYGPKENGKRLEKSDFNDYLGQSWIYPDESPSTYLPDPKRLHCLDCSGYMRMVWGYRHSFEGSGYKDQVPLSRKIKPGNSAMPRRSKQIYQDAPGVLIVENNGTQVTDFSKLSIGDLVFFDADPDDGPALDHVGMYLGLDKDKHHRFISSRKTINGPTLSDTGGKSLLDGVGLFAKAFRGVRRL